VSQRFVVNTYAIQQHLRSLTIWAYIPDRMARKKTSGLDETVFTSTLSSLTGASGSRPKMVGNEPADTLVALSGGPDSVALLHLIHAVSVEMGFMVAAAHVNYRLRGEESQGDERFCRDLCKQLGIKLHIKKASLSARKCGTNLQAEARRIRYSFFDEICANHQLTWIATGHNKTDNIETILMNLCRGAGTFGLSGIEPVSGKVIRPLLDFTREEIIAYLQQNHLPYRIDRSNLEGKYTRNKVRQQLLPVVVKIFGDKAIGSIARAGQILAQQEYYLRGQISRLLDRDAVVTPFGKIALDLKRFRRYDDLLKQLLIADCFERLTGSLQNFDLAAAQRVIKQVRLATVKADLTSGLIAEIAGERLYIYRTAKDKPSYAVRRKGSTCLQGYGMEISIEETPTAKLASKELRLGKNLKVYVDADKMRGKLTVRSPRVGDHFSPLGMKGSKKLSDFFIDRKIDRPLREEKPLLLCGAKIVWIIGHEIADNIKISARTRTALKLEVTQHREF
jgi:tRNA(Ile)-lysidine synthase